MADAIPAALTDEANVRDLVNMNRNLAERIRDWIGDFVAGIKKTIQRLGRYGGRYEIAALEKDSESLSVMYDMFKAALEDSRESGTFVDEASGKDVQFSQNDVSDKRSNGMNIKPRAEYTSAQWGNINNYLDSVDDGIIDYVLDSQKTREAIQCVLMRLS